MRHHSHRIHRDIEPAGIPLLDGHDVTPVGDIHRLGRLIGWILTGTWPQAVTDPHG
ncbi:hypothetical protein [Streptomyces sp. NPDC050263]|uniref:hypothetical protein n=1 Tax=Streptomyces sp. NPDC050263 TaxID=3155037 RepID=UPI003442EBB9